MTKPPNQEENPTGNAEQDPDDWVTGEELQEKTGRGIDPRD